MTTLRWDLFHESNYMETVWDERTTQLEARRYKAAMSWYPTILLAGYFGARLVGDNLRFLFYAVLCLPQLMNTVLALRDGTLLVSELPRPKKRRYGELFLDLIVLPYVTALILGSPADDLRRAVFVPWLVVDLCWLVYVLAHRRHLLQLAGEEMELPPVSRFEQPARALWALTLAVSLVFSGAAGAVGGPVLNSIVPGTPVGEVPAELEPLRGQVDLTWSIPEDGEVRVLTFRNETHGEQACGVWYIARQGDEAVRLGVTIRDGQVTAGRMSSSKLVTDPDNGSRYWTDWGDGLQGGYWYWREGRWQRMAGVDALTADERLCSAVWVDPVLDAEELAHTRIEDGLYQLWFLSGWSSEDAPAPDPEILTMLAYRLNGSGAVEFHQSDQRFAGIVYAWQRVYHGSMEELNAQIEGAFVPDWYDEALAPVWVSRDFD
ncbi:MAG: hypothetical protein IJ484_05220 [Oscillospiraceae bacterium]|nr:hypothetical protein [Oscillospiraceae bacterium]